MLFAAVGVDLRHDRSDGFEVFVGEAQHGGDFLLHGFGFALEFLAPLREKKQHPPVVGFVCLSTHEAAIFHAFQEG